MYVPGVCKRGVTYDVWSKKALALDYHLRIKLMGVRKQVCVYMRESHWEKLVHSL